MAESKGALIAKTVQKHAGRAKEKFLQNLGKVDRTLDDIFEEHLQNFNRQHQQATRLQKEFNNYIRCIRAVQTASKSLMEAITEVYESGWSGHDLLYVHAQSMDMLWQDYSHKLGDQVLIPLNTYTGQFPETRKKIEKRGRKLVDYDGQRHSFQNLQANAAKKRDDVKVTRGREQLEEAKRTYEVLNSELHDELPALHDSRVLFYVNNLQTLFAAEQLFHAETAKVYAELEAITDKLATESQRGSYTKRTLPNNVHSPPPASPASPASPAAPHHNGNAHTPVQTPPSSPATPTAAAVTSPMNGHKQDSPVAEKSPTPTQMETEKEVEKDTEHIVKKEKEIVPNDKEIVEKVKEIVDKDKADKDKKVEELYDIPTDTPTVVVPERATLPRSDDNGTQEVYDVPVGATLSGLPGGVLYRVRATYRYTREDDDELSFDVGDVINVVHYDDPEEQEEGWLMGYKENTNEKGMFPANFTRPI